MATSSQVQSSESQSTSTPILTQTPQSQFSLQLAQYLQQLGQQQYQWAQNEYARAGRVTDAQINNFINLAQQGQDLAGSAIGRYRDIYAPGEDAYQREAQMYDSAARREHEMGRAEARAQQAQKAAQINAENELESFGIDPSSGRYQDLVLASNTKAAADAAAAGETARDATEAEGQRRKLQAIAIGQQLPGQAVNALQSAYQGVSGAVNSALGLANTGANLTTSASRFLDPALHPMGPAQGQQTQSTSRGGGTSSSQSPEGGGARSGASPGGSRSPGGDGSGGGHGGYGGGYNPMGGYGGNGGSPTFGGAGYPYGNDVQRIGQDYWNQTDAARAQVNGDQPWDFGQEEIGLGNTGADPWSDVGAYDWGLGGGDQSFTPNSIGGGESPDAANWGNFGSGDSTDGALGGEGWWGGNPDASFPDSSSLPGSDWGSGGQEDFAGWGDYAQGGPVSRYRGGNGGGYVPPSMSPSGGQNVDDIQAVVPQTGGRAQINAGEFVLPRDVVQWKGQEFFQNMIRKARAARTGAPAKPSYKPPGGRNA